MCFNDLNNVESNYVYAVKDSKIECDHEYSFMTYTENGKILRRDFLNGNTRIYRREKIGDKWKSVILE